MSFSLVFICLLSLGMHHDTITQGNLDFELVTLPVYQPRIQVLDEDGKPLAPLVLPSLEFRDLKIGVPHLADTKELWQPKSFIEAASVLSCMLPIDFYQRLLYGIDEFMVNGEILDDPALTERVLDVAMYLAKIWDLNNQLIFVGDEIARDEFTFLSRILDDSRNLKGNVGSRCNKN